MIEAKRTKPKFEELISYGDFRFYCERQFLTDVAILNNEPRFQPRYVDRYNQLRQEIAEMTNELKYSAKWWAKNKQDQREKVLTEFVDALHFYCGMVIEEMTKNKHFEKELFDKLTMDAYELLAAAYEFQTLEESGVYIYAELDEVRRFLIDLAFTSFSRGAVYCMAAGFKIVSTFDVTPTELLAHYMDKNEVVHARNENGY